MKDHEFTLIVTGDVESDDAIDTLFEAGCDDATFGTVDGVGYADFIRAAPSFGDAVRTAIRDIETLAGLRVLRVEPDDMVTMNEIAQRMRRSRESVRLLIKGLRGPGGFPPPVSHLKARSRLWRWLEVASWAEHHDLAIDRVDYRNAPIIAALNAALILRRTSSDLSSSDKNLVTSLLEAA